MDRAKQSGRVTLGVYQSLWCAASPFLPLLLRARASRGKEDAARLSERFAHAAQQRPPCTLIWIHGASVGECLAALPLVSRLLEREDRHILVTSGTVTSAQLMLERLPPNAVHQYAPADRRDLVRRFLTHWHPDLALFVESELWPNLVLETKAANVPMALVNARLSERSFKNWLRARGLAQRILSSFDRSLAQDAQIAERLSALGARNVTISGSLKADAPPLPVDRAALENFREQIGGRPIFLAAQTHPGEDEIILRISETLHARRPDALSIIVPRHPARGEAIAALGRARKFRVARRAAGELPTPRTNLYIADTLGELGLFYRATTFAFLGGSLIAHGGHNPLEPATLGVAVLTGPHIHNFEDIFGVLLTAQGRGRVDSAEELSAEILALMDDPSEAARLGACANHAAAGLAGALDRTSAIAEELLARHG